MQIMHAVNRLFFLIEAPFNTIFTLPHIVCSIVTIFTMLIFSFYKYIATVEPPITDPPRSGQLTSPQRTKAVLRIEITIVLMHK